MNTESELKLSQEERWRRSDFRGQQRKVRVLLCVVPSPSGNEWTTQDILDRPAAQSNIPSRENIEWVLNGAPIEGTPTGRETYVVEQVQRLLLGAAEDAMDANALTLNLRPIWWWDLLGHLHRQGESVTSKLKADYRWNHAAVMDHYYTFLHARRPVLVTPTYVARALQIEVRDVHELVTTGELQAAVGMEAIEPQLYEFLDGRTAAHEANMWYMDTLGEEKPTAIYADDLLRLMRPCDVTGFYELTGIEDHYYHQMILRRFRPSRVSLWPLQSSRYTPGTG